MRDPCIGTPLTRIEVALASSRREEDQEAVRYGDPLATRAAMELLQALQQDQGLKPSPKDHIRCAVA